MKVERCPFYDPADVVRHVTRQVKNAQKKGEAIDNRKEGQVLNVDKHEKKV